MTNVVKKTELLQNSPGLISVVSNTEGMRVKNLDPAIYKLKADEAGNIYLMLHQANYTMPEVIHGKTIKRRTKKVMEHWLGTEENLGVLAVGHKGSGKSLQAELLCNEAIANGLPVVIVEDKLPAVVIETVSESIGRSVFYFDEYGKTYKVDRRHPGYGGTPPPDTDSGNELLRVFSNSTKNSTLFILTENKIESVSSYIINRPGRIYYRFDYDSIEEEMLREMAAYYKVKNDITEFLVEYIARAKVSIDEIKTLIGAAVNCADLAEFMEEFGDLNVSRPLYREVRVSAPGHLEDKFTDVKVRLSGDEVVLDCKDKTTGESLTGSVEVCGQSSMENNRPMSKVYNLPIESWMFNCNVRLTYKKPNEEISFKWGQIDASPF